MQTSTSKRGHGPTWWVVAACLALACGNSSATTETIPAETCPRGQFTATATPVDARSLRLDDGRVLRLTGIEPFDVLHEAPAAQSELIERLRSLLAAGPIGVALLPIEADRYGRLNALVVLADGATLQEAVLGSGLAVALDSLGTCPCFRRFLAEEDAARRSGRGFWGDLRMPLSDADALRDRIGRFTIFEGLVLSVGNRPGRTYLNFGRRWSEDVTGVIESRNRSRFGGEAALAAYSGRRVRLRGFLEESGGPMMRLRAPSQIELLDAGAPGRAEP